MKNIELILADVLDELFDYSSHTGELRWKSDRGPNKVAGQVAGCLIGDQIL